jgi:streptomycin 6-kinase
MLEQLPVNFTETISAAYGEAGRKWLARLPSVIVEIARDWQLIVDKHYPGLSYHFVAPVTCGDGTSAVLKVGFPEENQEMLNEVNALKHIGGHGMIKLLRFDCRRRAMLLEKLEPGDNLKTAFEGNEIGAVDIAIDIMQKLWREPPPPEGNTFPRLETWFNNCFEKAADTEFPREYIGKAAGFFEELNLTGRRVLLHGDLHHENILSAQREPFLAIDPKGITGNFGYEMSTFLINHRWWMKSDPDVKEKLDAAINRFAGAFKMPPEAIRKWTFAQSVLSAWWTFEENSDNWRRELELAEIWDI